MEPEASSSDMDVCYPELGEYLTTEYEILRRVFSYLPLDDLDNAKDVCEAWKSAAEITKKERMYIQSFVLSDQKYKMGKIWTEAGFSIAFCTAPSQELADKVSKHMKPDGQFLLCLSRTGVIGTSNDLSRVVQLKGRIGFPLAPKKFFLTSLRLPNFPDFGVKIFHWDCKATFQEFNYNFKLPENQIIKCLLILMMPDSRIASLQKDSFVSYLRVTQKENFAVGGCIVDKFLFGCPNEATVTYVVFYGKNVEAASTVLTSDIKHPTCIESKVEELKKNCPESDSSVLFVFRCAGRQRVLRRYKPKKNDITKWEGEAISKHFPSTPVVGCFGYGEFGNEYPCDSSSVSPNKRFKSSEIWEYSFSTSLVYLGFKNK